VFESAFRNDMGGDVTGISLENWFRQLRLYLIVWKSLSSLSLSLSLTYSGIVCGCGQSKLNLHFRVNFFWPACFLCRLADDDLAPDKMFPSKNFSKSEEHLHSSSDTHDTYGTRTCIPKQVNWWFYPTLKHHKHKHTCKISDHYKGLFMYINELWI
jgi:hypothetical protein